MSNDILEKLKNSLKNYVCIFIDEYGSYLDRYQLEIIKNINYDEVISFRDLSYPLGVVHLNQICLSSNVESLIEAIKNMPNFSTKTYPLNNTNYSSYLKYVCDNGYSVFNYYVDQLMYFVFKLVIKNESGLIDGLINYEICYLSEKYRLRMVNMYKKEEIIASRIVDVIGDDCARRLLFMDRSSSFNYLSNKLGYRYAKFIDDISLLIDSHYKNLLVKEYKGFDGILEYAKDYDSISYGEVYNQLLNFRVENNIL